MTGSKRQPGRAQQAPLPDTPTDTRTGPVPHAWHQPTLTRTPGASSPSAGQLPPDQCPQAEMSQCARPTTPDLVLLPEVAQPHSGLDKTYAAPLAQRSFTQARAVPDGQVVPQ